MLIKSLAIGALAITLTAANGNIITGTEGDDVLEGTVVSDVMRGLGGNDRLRGHSGDDQVHGGDGDDTLYGDAGDDALRGGPGDDFIHGDEGNDLHQGGDGDDSIRMTHGRIALIIPGLPTPTCRVASEHDLAFGGNGDDRIEWASGETSVANLVRGCVTSGNGQADGGAGDDVLFVGLGIFQADSNDYVIEPSPRNGYTLRLRSLETGATLDLRNIESVEFSDRTIQP